MAAAVCAAAALCLAVRRCVPEWRGSPDRAPPVRGRAARPSPCSCRSYFPARRVAGAGFLLRGRLPAQPCSASSTRQTHSCKCLLAGSSALSAACLSKSSRPIACQSCWLSVPRSAIIRSCTAFTSGNAGRPIRKRRRCAERAGAGIHPCCRVLCGRRRGLRLPFAFCASIWFEVRAWAAWLLSFQAAVSTISLRFAA